jgi:hypothetical protein
MNAAEAAAGVAKLTGVGRGRRMPATPESTARAIREETVHIFNVGPWEFRESMGSLGWYFIPACAVGAVMEWVRRDKPQYVNGVFMPDIFEPGKKRVKDPHTEYAAMKPLPGVTRELVPTEIDQMEWREEPRRLHFAEQLLGIGIGHSRQNSKTLMGCFIAEGKVPTEKELAKARHTMETEYMPALIREADQAAAAGPAEEAKIIRVGKHHVAAYWLGLHDRPWVRGFENKARTACKGCGTMVNDGVALCPQCPNIVHPEILSAAALKTLEASGHIVI